MESSAKMFAVDVFEIDGMGLTCGRSFDNMTVIFAALKDVLRAQRLFFAGLVGASCPFTKHDIIVKLS